MENLQLNFVVTSNMSPFIGQVTAATRAVEKFQAANVGSATAMASQAEAYSAFNKSLVSSGHFSTQMVQVRTEADKLGSSLAGQKLHWKEALGHVRQYRSEMGAISQLAEKQVRMQQGFVSGATRTPSGKIMADVVTPNQLQNVGSLATRSAIATEKLRALHETVRLGSDSMINLGKNTQWAGRQMMVGMTLPIAIVVGMATKAFVDMDKEIVRIQKVYGAGLNTNAEEFKKQGEIIRRDAIETSQVLAQQWGQSSKTTLKLEGDLAAVGKTGKDLQDSVKQMSRLSILGEIDPNAAMKAGLALQTAFKQNNEELTKSIDFMNSVENQTSTSMNDLVEAIPRAGATIHNLGGNIQELSLYMTAMREGGVSAGEGANSLKSGLAAIMAPADGVKKKLLAIGIDMEGIVRRGGGDLTKTLMMVGKEMEKLNPVEKTQAMVNLFGRFQFNKMAALLNNLGKEGSQTLTVLDLIGKSPAELAKNSEIEMSAITESASGKFKRMMESMKVNMAKLGEDFLGPVTAIVRAVTGIIGAFNGLPDIVKKFVEWGAIIAALVGPIVMVAGVFMNFIGTVVKGGVMIGAIFKKGLRGGWKEWTADMSGAKAMAEGMIKPMESMKSATLVLSEAVEKLTRDLRNVADAGIIANSSLGRLVANTSVSNPANKNFASTGTVAETKEANQNTAGRPIQSWTASQLASGGASNMAAIKVSQDAMLRGELMGFKSKEEMFNLLKQARAGNVRAQQAMDETVQAYIKTPRVQAAYNAELAKATANTQQYAADVMAQSALLGSKGVGGDERAYRAVTSTAHSLIREPGGSLGNAPTLAPTERSDAKLNMWANQGPNRVDAGHIVARAELAQIQMAKLAGDEAALSAILESLGLTGKANRDAMMRNTESFLTVEEANVRIVQVETELVQALKKQEFAAISAAKAATAAGLQMSNKKWLTSSGAWMKGVGGEGGALDKQLASIGVQDKASRERILAALRLELKAEQERTGKTIQATRVTTVLKELLDKEVLINGELVNAAKYRAARTVELNGLVYARSKAEAENLALTEKDNAAKAAQLAADQKSAATARRKAIIGTAGGAAGALGMAAMMIPQSEGTSGGSTALSIAGKAGMGAMVGMMLGSAVPVIGNGIGALVGAAVGATAGAIGKLGEASKKTGDEIVALSKNIAKANEKLSSDVITKLGGKPKDVSLGLAIKTDVAGNYDYSGEMDKFVKENSGEKIKALSELTTAQAAVAVKNVYNQLVSSGVAEKSAKSFVDHLMKAAGHTEAILDLNISLSTGMGEQVGKSIQSMVIEAAKAYNESSKDWANATGGWFWNNNDFLSEGKLSEKSKSVIDDQAKAIGETMMDGIREGMKRWKKQGLSAEEIAGKVIGEFSTQTTASVGGMVANMGKTPKSRPQTQPDYFKFEASKSGNTPAQNAAFPKMMTKEAQTDAGMAKQYLSLTAQERVAIQNLSSEWKEYGKTVEEQSNVIADSMISSLGPEQQAVVAKITSGLMDGVNGLTKYQATLFALSTTQEGPAKTAMQNAVRGMQGQSDALGYLAKKTAEASDPAARAGLESLGTALQKTVLDMQDWNSKADEKHKINMDLATPTMAKSLLEDLGITFEELAGITDQKQIDIIVNWHETNKAVSDRAAKGAKFFGTQEEIDAQNQKASDVSAADAASAAADQAQKDAQEAQDALSKSFADQEQAMQDALTAEEEAMQKQFEAAQKAREDEIARVEKFYDDKIAAINKEEEVRKKAFDEEKKRQDREKTWQQLQLDLVKARAKGDTFGILKASMDMRSTQKGWGSEDKDAKATDKAKTKTDKLGKEKITVTGNLKKKGDAQTAKEKDILDAKKKEDAARLASQKKTDQAILDSQKKADEARIKSMQDAAKAAQTAAGGTNDAVNSMKFTNQQFADALGVALQQTGGDFTAALALIQTQYGLTKEEMTAAWDEWAKNIAHIPVQIVDSIDRNIKPSQEQLLLLGKIIKAISDNDQGALSAAALQMASGTGGSVGTSVSGKENAATDNRSWMQMAIDVVTHPNAENGKAVGEKADGGYISGPGGPTSDSIPAHLSNGEYVIRASAVSKYGKHFLDQVNAKKFADGGAVGKVAAKDATAGTAVPGAPTAAGKVEEALSDATKKLSDDRTVGDKKAIKTDKDLATQKIKSTQDSFTNALDDATALNARQTQMENLLFTLKQTHIAALLTQTTNAETTMNAAIVYRKQLQLVSFNELQSRNATLISDFNTQWATWKDNSVSDIKEAATTLNKSFAAIDYKLIVDMVTAFATGDADGKGAAAQQQLLAKADGGYISGPGSGTSDSIPARLSNGEYVIKNASVQRYGTSFLDKVNQGQIPAGHVAHYAEGGLVGQLAVGVSKGLNDGAAAAVQKAIDVKNAALSAASGGSGTWNGITYTPEQITSMKGKYKFGQVLAGGAYSDTNGKQYQNGGGPHHVQQAPLDLWSLPDSAWGVNDIAADVGTPVYAYAPGTIIWARSGGGWDPGYVKQSVDYFPGGEVLYGHTPPEGMVVKEGDHVEAGQLLAHTGFANFAHLHIEWHDVPTLTQRDEGTVPWLAGGGFISPELMSMAANHKIGADPANWKLTPKAVVAKGVTANGGTPYSGPITPYTGDATTLGFPPEVSRWAGEVQKALKALNLPGEWLPGILGQIQQESSGDPMSINLEDSNARMGDPSRGLMQTIGSTFSGAAPKGFEDISHIYEPYPNIYAGINYAYDKYGQEIFQQWLSGSHPAYATGGYVSGPGTGRSDSVPARLSNGEYVVQESAVSKYGVEFLNKVNKGQLGQGGAAPAWAAGISTVIDGKVADLVRKQLNIDNLKRTVKIPEAAKAIATAAAAGIDGKAEVKDGLLYGVTSATIVEHAKKALGTPYSTDLRGGGPGVGFDCSSFAYWAYEGYPGLMKNGWGPNVGWTGTLKDEGKPRDMAAIKAGDILLHDPDSTGGHAALYIGNGQIQHSANPNQISSVDVWGGFEQARQILAMANGGLVIPALRRGATINYDNTLANLHRGEAVLTEPLTQKLNKGIDDLASGSHVAYNVSVNIDKANATPYEIEQAVYSALNKKEIRSGRSRVIGGRK